jgi:hypothetical protein
MVHKQKKKREMAFQVYILYPLFHQKKPMPLGEQRKYRIDAETDLFGITTHPLFKLVKGKAFIKREPATKLEIKERKMLEKMGLGKQSVKRGLIETFSVD